MHLHLHGEHRERPAGDRIRHPRPYRQARLTGGGYRHEWLSGGDKIPSFTFEIGHPKLITPVFFRHLGTVMESLSFEMGQEGPANGTVQLVAQGEEKAAATIDATPDAYPLKRFSQGRGFIKGGGVPLAGVTGGNLNFSNNLHWSAARA